MGAVPQNIDAEVAIIGAALNPYEQKMLPELAVLTPDDFADQKHKRIWACILKLLQDGKTPDPLLLKEELGAGDEITLAHLLIALERSCLGASTPHYVKILQEKERGRRVYFAARKALAAVGDSENYDEIESELLDSLARRTVSEGTTFLHEAGSFEEMVKNKAEQPWVTFGIDELDAHTGGIRPGEVCILAARTSVGKSACAVASTLHSAEAGWKPLYMSYEMAKLKLWQRMLSYQSRVSLKKFRDNDFNHFDAQDVKGAEQELIPVMKNIRVNIEANTPERLAQLIRMEHIAGYADYVILDHAGRMKVGGKSRGRYEDATEIIQRIKDMAIQFDIPILVLWQLSRKTEMKADKRPSLDDLRDTGHVEEVADMVVFMWRDSYYDRSIPVSRAMVNVDVAKARDGGTLGEIQVPWLRFITRSYIVPAEAIGSEVQGVAF